MPALVAGIHVFTWTKDVDGRNKSGHDGVGTSVLERAPHILPMPARKTREKCPTCGKPADELLRPFCSKRCADVDLHRWFSGKYAIPVTEDEEEDDQREENGEPN
jgi:uncharacterized protein